MEAEFVTMSVAADCDTVSIRAARDELIASLAVDALDDNAALEELIAWSVAVRELLRAVCDVAALEL